MPSEIDERITALADERPFRPGLRVSPDGPAGIGSAALAQQVLRDRRTIQAGFNADLVRRLPQRNTSVLFAEGETHRAQRAMVASLFTRAAVSGRLPRIAEIGRDIVARFRARGEGLLDEMALELTVRVVAEIIGLTEGPGDDLARKLAHTFELQRSGGATLGRRVLYILRVQHALAGIYLAHVRPAIRSRRRERRDDLVSRLLDRGSTHLDILTECITYGTAGLSTTREFIGAAALHLLASPDLRRRFVEGSLEDRRAILGEILRLEPPVSRILRRTTADIALGETDGGRVVPEGRTVAIDLRSVNADPALVGSEPGRLDPDRPGAEGGGLSFGFGHHRCPGTSLAIEETAEFLHALLQVPGLELASEPRFERHPVSTGYVVRNCRLVVREAAGRA